MERLRRQCGHGNHDSSRRTFRGRGGPRDGNLPKKHPRSKREDEGAGSVGDDNDDDGAPVPTQTPTPGENGTRETTVATRNEGNGGVDADNGGDETTTPGTAKISGPVAAVDEEGDGSEISTTATEDSRNGRAPDRVGGEEGVVEEEEGGHPVQRGAGLASSEVAEGDEYQLREEKEEEDEERLRRLMHKIRNVRSMVRSSSGSLRASLDQWRTNCLNPTRNCVASWRSFVRTRLTISNDTGGTVECGDQDGWCKGPSLAVFELMQSAMQSGPLSGGKPGYFKRCGSEVASVALSFLRDCSGTTDDRGVDGDGDGGDTDGEGGGGGSGGVVEARLRSELRFTERQASAVCRWMRDAGKAAAFAEGGAKPPSKSVMKQQQKEQRILDKKREVRSKKAAKARARREKSSDLEDNSNHSDRGG